MLDLLTLATFLFITSLVWLAAILLRRRWMVPAGMALPGAGTGRAADDRFARAVVEGLAAQVPQGWTGGEELDKDLRRAGYYRPGARQRLAALRNGLAILVIVAAGAIAVGLGPTRQKGVFWTLGIGALTAILVWSVPRMVLAINARRRVLRIRSALPDALDIINMCLEGGVSLRECLTQVGRETLAVHPDLGIELLIVGQQTEIDSFEFAVQQFAARIDAPEVISLAAIVTQNQRLGTGIAESIREFADNLRLKRRQMAEAKASLAELFLLFPVVFCLVPSVVLLLWGPFVLQLVEHLRTSLPIRIPQ
ncbi:MAG: type II secretion system F family protein [Thermoguttaceae bacterium]|jgi:tight adherence protein C